MTSGRERGEYKRQVWGGFNAPPGVLPYEDRQQLVDSLTRCESLLSEALDISWRALKTLNGDNERATVLAIDSALNRATRLLEIKEKLL